MYVWADGVRDMFAIDTVVNGVYYCDIGRVGGEWHLTFKGKTYVSKAGERRDFNSRLYPYIGGSETVDHDWIVPIKFY